MRPRLVLLGALAVGLAAMVPVAEAKPEASSTATAVVGAGTYRPLFPPTPSEAAVDVPAFRIDRVPVTNGDFLAFVRARPEWARDRVAPVLAEPAYLSHWAGPHALGSADADQPVVDVSWFAARAFCTWRGARLPSEAEWERAAAASRTSPDGSADPTWQRELLAIYSRPRDKRLPKVGATEPNFWGVRDLHGVVWEWVLDFGNAVASSGAGSDRLRFCGAGASTARDATDFAAFERAALRSSLRGDFVLANLGFRCAADVRGDAK